MKQNLLMYILHKIVHEMTYTSNQKQVYVDQVEEKKKKYHLGQRGAEVEVVIDRLIKRHGGSMDLALLSVLSESCPLPKVSVNF